MIVVYGKSQGETIPPWPFSYAGPQGPGGGCILSPPEPKLDSFHTVVTITALKP